MDEKLSKAATAWGLKDVCPLTGDAGTRRYFRASGRGEGPAVIVLYDDTRQGADDPFMDFLSLRAYLEPLLRVPKLYECDESARAMLLEDLGDTSLEGRLTLFPSEEMHWASKAAWELSDWVGPLTIALPESATFARRSFDAKKYDFEWAFCAEHFFNGLLRKNPPLWLDRMMGQVRDFLAPRAKYLAHRDFHVRNLMVCGDRLATIDFQDARMGPCTYDLASIMFDSYWDWAAGAKEALAAEVKGCLGIGEADFWGELTHVGLQRNFKALGTFAFQMLQKGNFRYSTAVPRALRHIQGHFECLAHGEGVIQARHWQKAALEMMQKAIDR
ncbi:MAG: phosphotransferase [Holophagales bacterium]|jgi:aminoglycoside/choline kinase family phosphotransferase|nr:phosphotransferase [Holophagales bacterium]